MVFIIENRSLTFHKTQADQGTWQLPCSLHACTWILQVWVRWGFQTTSSNMAGPATCTINFYGVSHESYSTIFSENSQKEKVLWNKLRILSELKTHLDRVHMDVHHVKW